MLIRYIRIATLLVFFASCTHAKDQYVPIVLVHGLFSDAHEMTPTQKYIKKYMGSDVYVKRIEIGEGELTSFENLHAQAEHLRQKIQKNPNLKNGFNIVAHSQGGLLARYYIERYNNPPVLTYISWGSPQQGVFGTPGTLDKRLAWLNYLERYSHLVLYSGFAQTYISFASYWHDTLHYEDYLAKSTFLPYVNNQIDHKDAEQFKRNICSLKNMVLVMSTKENIIEPRISCHFGFYKPGSKSVIQKIFDTDIYKNDSLGLKTLYESGRLHLRIAHCTHENYQEDEQNFVENTLEYLKANPNATPKNMIGVRDLELV